MLANLDYLIRFKWSLALENRMSSKIFWILILLKLTEISASVPHDLSRLIWRKFFDLNPIIVHILVKIIQIFWNNYELHISCKFSKLIQNIIKILSVFLDNLLAIINKNKNRPIFNTLYQFIQRLSHRSIIQRIDSFDWKIKSVINGFYEAVLLRLV